MTTTDEDATRDEIRGMKIKDIKAELTSLGVPIEGLFEKDELVEALVEARRRSKKANDDDDDDDIEAPATVPEDDHTASLRRSTLESARQKLSEFATSFAAEEAAAAAAAAASAEEEEEEEEEENGWPTGFYTNLRADPSRKKHRWEKNAKGPVSPYLTDRLKKNPNFVVAEKEEEEGGKPEEGEETKTNRAAAVARETVAAPGRWLKKGFEKAKDVTVGNKEEEEPRKDEPQAKGNDVADKKSSASIVRPSFELIGLDAFRVEQHGKGPKAAVCKEDLIVRAGLRRRPTFVVNLIFPFGNVVLYYRMPDWVKSFKDGLDEQESDPPDVKALKRFLSGDANYRAQRLQAYLAVARSPLALRPFASPKKEISILLGALPLRWRQGGAKYDSSSSDPPKRIVKHAILEADVDLSTDPDSRKVSNVAERFMKLCTVDVALVVGELPPDWNNERKEKPNDGVDATKPCACLGISRLDRIDVSRGATIPDADEKN